MSDSVEKRQLSVERHRLLRNFNDLIDRPLTYLSFVWFGIVILEFTVGVNAIFEYISFAIWGIFIADFFLELIIAPSVKKYLRQNWFIALTLLLPALRIFRIFRPLGMLRTARALRSLSLLRIVTSLNRSIIAWRRFATNYGVRYITVFTFLVLTAGAAGILFFENSQALADRGISGEGISTYPNALWWAVMLMTTIGSDYWPQTLEGRILTVVLSLYAIAIFGYITATLASLLIKKNTNLKIDKSKEAVYDKTTL